MARTSTHTGRSVRWQAAAIAAACLAAGAVLLGWLWIRGAFLPRWIDWQRVEVAADLDGDGDLEAVRLAGRRVSVCDSGASRVVSKDGWLVSDALVGDVDRDGVQELVLIAWKRGSYGTSRPFWVARDSLGFSEHVFIFRYRDGGLKPVWMSSDIGFEAQHAWLDAHDDLHLADTAGDETVWEWQDFGLILIDGMSPSLRAGEKTATFMAAGDNIAHAGMLGQARAAAESRGASNAGTYDFSPVYDQVAGWVGSYDLAAVCQETPFVADGSQAAGYPRFATPTEMGDALLASGFDVVASATNHAYDQGAGGLADTVSYWFAHPEAVLLGIRDADEPDCAPRYIVKNGIRLALFDATAYLNAGTQEDGDEQRINLIGDGSALAEGLREAEGAADASICFLHIGDDLAPCPSEETEQLVRKLIDAGADVVICSHPHVVQRAGQVTTDLGATGWVCYSLGNAASNQPYPETVLGAAATFTLVKRAYPDGTSKTEVADFHLVPTVCHQESDQTRVCLLQDYSDELAKRHAVNQVEKGSVTLEGLQAQWDESVAGE